MFCRKKFHTSAWGKYPPPPLVVLKRLTLFFSFFFFFSWQFDLINDIKKYGEHNYKIVIYASNNWSRPTPLGHFVFYSSDIDFSDRRTVLCRWISRLYLIIINASREFKIVVTKFWPKYVWILIHCWFERYFSMRSLVGQSSVTQLHVCSCL